MQELERFFNDKYLNIMLKTRPAQNGKGCILYTGVKCRPDGYISIKMNYPKHGAKHHSLVHRFVYALYHKINSFEDIEHLEVSHICHVKLCINIAHLCLETHQVNKDRQTCCGNPQRCQHEPRCII